MKSIFTISFLLLIACFAEAQQLPNSAGNPNLVILKKRWYLTVPDKGAGDDPFKALKDQAQARQDLLDMKDPYPVASSRLMDPKFTVQPVKTYHYELKVKNTAGRTIQRIFWDYSLAESNTNEQAGKFSFVSNTTIKPGKVKKIIMPSTLRPAKINKFKSNAQKNGKKLQDEVHVRRIEYSDGTIWSAY